MSLESVFRRYRQVDQWFEARPFVHGLVLAVVIGSVWAVSAVLINGQSPSTAARYGLVAGIAAFAVASSVALVRR
ncbi:hypothetical protein [Natrinema soli]|uniref:Uncharacterized protein n=1 Tax=Natrinema soli TaxID=1930624 RepID=A0ABD5SF15_9EURY|nr:hypothetical protein [Natrinema soli]